MKCSCFTAGLELNLQKKRITIVALRDVGKKKNIRPKKLIVKNFNSGVLIRFILKRPQKVMVLFFRRLEFPETVTSVCKEKISSLPPTSDEQILIDDLIFAGQLSVVANASFLSPHIEPWQHDLRVQIGISDPSCDFYFFTNATGRGHVISAQDPISAKSL